jgi:hypothetical protein
MWRFSKNTPSNMMKNICGEFHRPFRTDLIVRLDQTLACLANFQLSLWDEA